MPEFVTYLPGEDAVKEGGANLQRGIEAVGGTLTLTDQRLIFEPHDVNVQKQPLAINLADVVHVRKCWTKLFNLIPLVPNSIAVETTDGQEHRFVLFGRQKWINAIEQQRESK